VGLFALKNGVRFVTLALQLVNEKEKRNRPKTSLSISRPNIPTHVSTVSL